MIPTGGDAGVVDCTRLTGERVPRDGERLHTVGVSAAGGERSKTKQFEQSRDMMKAVGSMGMMGKLRLMKHLMSGDLNSLGMPGGPTLKVKKSGFMEKKDRNKKKKRR